MKRRTGLSATLLFLSATAPLMFAQDLQGLPKPALPPNIPGPRLIASSQLQQPRPVSQPASLTDPQPQPTAQTFPETIEPGSGKYVLKVSSNSACQLDDQGRARQHGENR